MTFTADTKGSDPLYLMTDYPFSNHKNSSKKIQDPVTDTDPLCCDIAENKRNEECYPVEIPSGDPFYALFRRRCMEFVRSASSLKGECKLG
jgi:hypothetical protein